MEPRLVSDSHGSVWIVAEEDPNVAEELVRMQYSPDNRPRSANATESIEDALERMEQYDAVRVGPIIETKVD